MSWTLSRWIAAAIVIAFAGAAWALTRPEPDHRTPEETRLALLAAIYDDAQHALCTPEGKGELRQAVRDHADALRRRHGMFWSGPRNTAGPQEFNFAPEGVDAADNVTAIAVFTGAASRDDLYGPMQDAARPLLARVGMDEHLQQARQAFNEACVEAVALYEARAERAQTEAQLVRRLDAAREARSMMRINDALRSLVAFRANAEAQERALQDAVSAKLAAS